MTLKCICLYSQRAWEIVEHIRLIDLRQIYTIFKGIFRIQLYIYIKEF